MIKFVQFSLGLFLFVFTVSVAHAQQLPIEVNVIKFYSNARDEHTFHVTTSLNGSNYAKLQGTDCFAHNGGSNSDKTVVPDGSEGTTLGGVYKIANTFSGTPKTLYIQVEGYEKDKDNSNRCIFNDNGGICGGDCADDSRGYGKWSVNLSTLRPGVWSSQLSFFNNNGGGNAYGMIFKIRYAIPTPQAPVLMMNGSTIPTSAQTCGQQEVQLKANFGTTLANKQGLRYIWEYAVGTPLVWRSVTASSGSSQDSIISFIPTQLVSQAGKTFETNLSIRFRVKAQSTELASSISPTRSYNFSPPPPSVGDPATDIIINPSCPGTLGTGTILVQNITGLNNYLYILKDGVNTTPCSPEEGNCFQGSYSGTMSGSSFTITGIKGGQYTLWLANGGDTLGLCSQTYTIIVPETPVLSFSGASSVDASCYNTSTGSVTVSSSGGREPIVYTIKNGTDIRTQTVNTTDTPFTFTNLPVGSYVVSVSDACNQSPATQTVIIKQPARITVGLTSIAALCNSPGDGKVQTGINVSNGTFDIPVSGRCDYEVRKSGVVVQSAYDITGMATTFTGLVAGNDYTLRVKDHLSADWCSGEEKAFVIDAPPAIPAPAITIGNVACPGGADGALTITGTGGDGKYQYTLKRIADGQTIFQTTDTYISGLSAGSYQLIVTRIHATCSDSYTYPSTIVITQPNPLAITSSKTDITCYGMGDGKITATLSGGTAPYTLYYKRDADASWISLTGLTVNNLDKGNYQLRVVDSHNCETVSSLISIAEPALLQLTTVSRKDIVCLGDNGFIDMTATGGTLPYTFEYSLNNGAWTAFDKNTPLAIGSYQVRVRDARGCVTVHPSNLSITAPASALDFSYTVSDYNGYNISCFGGNNGTLTFAATGGNGASYNGYQYAIDGGTYQSAVLIEGITAGTHTFSVKDGRGCVVTKSVVFTQILDKLNVQLESKQNVICAGDATGSVTVKATGGVGPYSYSLNGGSYQSSPTFSSLPAGSYQISVRDQNGCSISLTENISSLYAPIVANVYTENIRCKSGQDGLISLSVSGGVAPYSYQWSGMSSNSETVSGLSAGTYSVKIVDAVGCSINLSATLSEPVASVSLSTKTTPVCYGQTTGLIVIKASGGTPPYLYSVDNGLSYQSDPSFSTVGVGTYPLVVQDSQGCSVSGTAVVGLRNDQPMVDFIVASSQQALDTLYLEDISLPKPDSVHWDFGAMADWIDTSMFSPAIRFASEGSYAVSMTGYFGGCAYTISRTLVIAPYDPNQNPVTIPDYNIIKKFSVSPNPNDGQFVVSAELIKKQQVMLVITDLLGNEKFRKKWDRTSQLSESIFLNVPSGLYIVRIITDNDAREIRLSINH
ncbi:T9SS type A sorting domain-containing protein [Xanthocytophaga flava]|uniref:T9SS type A sorting domain-containing protein n=1 Tax=Xanthocytophaga flava TaxID=3048013 RepID=UPI0028D25B8B|nr:T9SS type A sorting domain-containing protein [Xanthocytophaga flavus]MDJ1470971.1 T9SS type A sorting domain-containing protein [Xanthocytophaga flavus]